MRDRIILALAPFGGVEMLAMLAFVVALLASGQYCR